MIEIERLRKPLIEAERDAMLATASFTTQAEGAETFGYSRLKTPAPNRISVLTGEAIQALRRALDYLVYEIAFRDSGSEQDGTQFPIEHSPNVFWSRLNPGRGGYLVGVDRKHATALKRYQPCDQVEWSADLRDLSNPDKHRRLSVLRHLDKTTAARMENDDGATYRNFAATDDGFEVWWTVGDDVHMQLQVTIDIAFESGLGVIEALQEIKAQIAYVLDEFRPCFALGTCPHGVSWGTA